MSAAVPFARAKSQTANAWHMHYEHHTACCKPLGDCFDASVLCYSAAFLGIQFKVLEPPDFCFQQPLCDLEEGRDGQGVLGVDTQPHQM